MLPFNYQLQILLKNKVIYKFQLSSIKETADQKALSHTQRKRFCYDDKTIIAIITNIII